MKTLPHVAVIDPRTRQRVKAFEYSNLAGPKEHKRFLAWTDEFFKVNGTIGSETSGKSPAGAAEVVDLTDFNKWQ